MRTALGILSLFLIASLSGCLTGGSVQDVEAPAWSPGYAWSWNTTGESREVFYLKVGDERPEQREEQGPISPLTETVEVLNTTTSLDGTPVYLTAYWNSRIEPVEPACFDAGAYYPGGDEYCGGGSPAAYLTAVRQADLAELPLRYNLPADNSPVSDLAILDVPEYPLLDFPLESGKTWGGPVDREDPDDPRLLWEQHARVTGSRSVDTALGRMDAVRVEVLVAPADLEAYKQAILEDADEEGVDVDQFDYRTSTRTVLYYSEEAQTVVRVETERVEEIAAIFEEDGQRHELRAHESFTATTVLTGVQLYERPERDLGYVGRVLRGQVPMADPTGAVPDPRHVTLTIDSDVRNVNVAAGEEATFTANVTDSADNESQLELRWALLDYDRSVVERGTNATFAPSIDQPGLYGVQAEVVAPGTDTVLAAKEIPFEAYFDGTFTLQRIADVWIYTLGDEAFLLPVNPGIERLEVTADAQGFGYIQMLRVYDAQGEQVAQATGSGAAIEITDFSDVFVTGEPWIVEWDDTWVGALESVEIHVVERYGADGAIAQPVDDEESAGLVSALRTGQGPDDGLRFW